MPLGGNGLSTSSGRGSDLERCLHEHQKIVVSVIRLGITVMSLHRSLKTKPAGLNQHRNVLTRAERIEMLEGEDRFDLDR